MLFKQFLIFYLDLPCEIFLLFVKFSKIFNKRKNFHFFYKKNWLLFGEAELIIPIKFKFCGANFFKQSGKISASSLTKIFRRSIKVPTKHNLWKEFWQLKEIFFGAKIFNKRKIFHLFYKKIDFYLGRLNLQSPLNLNSVAQIF